jgi:DUF1680 family protein
VSYEIAGRHVMALQTEFYQHKRDGYDRNALYQTFHYQGISKIQARMIPYFAWDNRGFGEMKIWIPIAYPVN